MSRQTEKIKKMFNDTLRNGLVIEHTESYRKVIEECEKNGKLFSYKNLFISPVLTNVDDQTCMRIVIAIKEENAKVQNVDTIIQLIKDLEEVMTYLDSCIQYKVDNFIYLDVLKKLKEK